jgi:bifunctional N-acetylglutamate synthase/kinase
VTPKPREPAVLEPAEAVLRFLASVGPSSDAELYLRLFRSRAPESFAALTVGAAAIEHHVDGVALDLRFLRSLGLTPLVVLGLHAPDTAAGDRRELQARLVSVGVHCEMLETDAAPERIAAAVTAGAVPLLVATGSGRSQRLELLARMLSALHTHKLILLEPRGGLSVRGARVSVVNLSADYDALCASGELDPGQHVLLDDSRRLIFELVPHRLLVSMTSPLNLMHELFTVKGAGTLLRRGARITRHDGFSGVDRPRLEALLTSSFGKPSNPDLFARPLEHAYVEESYRGAALVVSTALGGYLSKFAVTREAQGEGIGQDLWSVLTADYPALVWRARSENPIRAWYERHCQGRFESGPWTVYVRGVPSEKIAEAIAFALAQPLDF